MKINLTTNSEGHMETVELVLSKRNLLTLLHKVDDPDSANIVYNRDTYVNGVQNLDVPIILAIRAEPDEIHYKDRPAGQMDPDAEEFINLQKEKRDNAT